MRFINLNQTALITAYRNGYLHPNQWLANALSGLVVGIVALPLAMAFAIASGARPEQGIYTAIIAALIVSTLGGSRWQIAGPTGAFIVVLSSITRHYGIEGLQVATLMAGLILISLGVARLGGIIRFIPQPVILGFTAGVAVVIAVGQGGEFFGLPDNADPHVVGKLLHLLATLPSLDLPTTVLALVSLLIVAGSARISFLRRIPGPLSALVFATVCQTLWQFPSIRTIGVAYGGLPSGLPAVHWPMTSPGQCIELIGPAFTIAMLGAIESLLSAVVADGMTGTRHNSNQELIGQGLANLCAPFLGGFASTGALARTATNIRNGATGPLSGLVHCLVLILVLLFCAPLARHVPLAALAAILLVVAWNMSDVQTCVKTARGAPNADRVILLVTFLLTVFADIVVAVNIGVILATLQFMRRMASTVEVIQTPLEDMTAELKAAGLTRLSPDTVVYSVQGPLFFAAAQAFENALANAQSDPHHLIIRLKAVPFMDLTGLTALIQTIEALQRRQVIVILCEANPRVLQKLQHSGVLELVGPNNNTSGLAQALIRATHRPQNSS